MNAHRFYRHYKIIVFTFIAGVTSLAHGKQQFMAKIYDKFDTSKFSVQPLAAVNFGSENKFRGRTNWKWSGGDLGSGPSMAPDANGCFCFSASDFRSAYVRAFFFSVKEIEFYNQLAVSFNLPGIKKIAISLDSTPGVMSAGQAHRSEFIDLKVSDAVFDETILGHEVGHAVHFAIQPAHSNAGYGYEKSLFTEGSANLLSALYFQTSRIGEAELFEVAYAVAQELKFPDEVITIGEVCRKATLSEAFKSRFHYKFDMCTERLKTYRPGDGSTLDVPYVYQSAAVFTQPLWEAAKKYGRDALLRAYLPALLKIYELSTLKGVVETMIVEIKKANPEMAYFLREYYGKRGII